MFRSEYIDLAIGLAVVFFLTSLIVSGLNEGLQWIFRVRGKFLWAYLYDLADPDRAKKLPSGLLGIMHLWKGNDQRPVVPPRPTGDAVAPPPPEAPRVVAEGSTSVMPKELVSRVATALDPMDLPVRKSRNRGRRSGIQSVPAGSLAQALLEVFADIGKQRLADDLAKLAKAHHDGTPLPVAIQPVLDKIAPIEAPRRGQIERALVAFISGSTSATTSAETAARLLEDLRGVEGAVPQPTLVPAATAYVDAIRDQESLAQPAHDLAGSLARMFPEPFNRRRIEIAVGSLDQSPLGPTARRLWDAAAGDIDKFRTSLESYFDDEMKRLSGHYRRSLRAVMIGLAVVVAVACNVDALNLARDLWRNPEGRAALVAQADALTTPTSTPSATTTTSAAGATGTTTTTNPSLAAIQDQCRQAAPASDSKIENPDDAAKAFNDVRRCVTDALSATSGLNVVDKAVWVSPSGWARSWFTGDDNWWLHLAGVILTALALIVGAPFWFDVLKRLTGIRRTTQA